MRIYLDHNATTPVDPVAAEAMMRSLQHLFGNASSVHYYGQQAKAALDNARSALAALVGAEPAEVIFTSGGTEADNFAIRGAAEALEPSGRKHLITSGIEHEAVLNTFKALAKRGWRTTVLPLDASGSVSADRLRDAMTEDTALVSIMHANNEIGTIQPITELATIAHAHGALFHTDAVQSVGKIPVNVRTLGVDLLAVSGHKFYGPKGIGALWVKRGVRLSPFLSGGKQERNRRAGTENVPGAIGMGIAASLAMQKMDAEAGRLSALRDRLEAALGQSSDQVTILGKDSERLPNTSCFAIAGKSSETLVMALDLAGYAISAGSACSSGKVRPSHVALAMGLGEGVARGALRVSLGAWNKAAEVDGFVAQLSKAAGLQRHNLPSMQPAA